MIQRPLDGYAFPVYTTESCPRNLTEWMERSSIFNCTWSNAYMCVPDENITKLLEFCYSLPQIQFVKGIDNHEMKFILYLTGYCYFNSFAAKYVYLMYTEYQFTSMKILKQRRKSPFPILFAFFSYCFQHFVHL